MINALIRFSLQNRPIIIGVALLVLVYGAVVTQKLPIDVLPDLTRPTVTIMTEAPGLAPEEVETLVTVPIENAVAGATGILRLRSNSDMGLSLVFVEFDWGVDVYHARQIVQERLQAARDRLPENMTPVLGPVSSLLGEILLVGLRSDDASMDPMQLRTLADWTVARRLQSLPGVSQVLAIGGGVSQLQVLPEPEKMLLFGVTLEQLQQAVGSTAKDTNSGYLETASREMVVRNLGMTLDLEAFQRTPVRVTEIGEIVIVADVAEVRYAPGIMRGDAGVNGLPGVIMGVQKSPGVDTIRLTKEVEQALDDLRVSLPKGVSLTVLFRQAEFIEHALDNLFEAVRDGAVMVSIILLLFLLNIRTTLITLMAIPLSFAVTLIVFHRFGFGMNAMTLGGIAVALGMVVDDAIVDVENVFRRLRENRQSPNPKPVIEVVMNASIEVRGAILYATLLIILVFVPLFALQGVEGQLFAPIAAATIVSMLASFLVAITVIPVLASLFLPGMKRMTHERDAWLVRGLKYIAKRFFLKPALDYPCIVMAGAALVVAFAFALWPITNKTFLPPFNEGSAIITMVTAPGTSLQQSNQMGQVAERMLLEIPEVASVGRRTGRAEMDEHVMPVNVNELDVEFHSEGRPRREVLREIRERLGEIPGVYLNIGQPISHRIDHMLSGVQAQLAIKIFGDDLDVLRLEAQKLELRMRRVGGLTDINIENQLTIPQIHIIPNREVVMGYGIRVGELNQWLADAVGGRHVGELRDKDRTMDVVVRMNEDARDSREKLQNLLVNLPSGGYVPLSEIAEVRESEGPNLVNRENGRRRIIVSANVEEGQDLVSIVDRLREVTEQEGMPEGYYLSFEGQYQAQQQAMVRMAWIAGFTLLAMILLLYGHFRSLSLVIQTIINVPFACAGALFFSWLLVGQISLATLIGMIALAGIASRNTILMLSHYLHLMRHEGEGFTREMVIRGSLERLVPVSMTALTAMFALLPLALSPDAPGKEILYPVAVAIIGGLLTSTILDCLVTPTVFYHFTGKKVREGNLSHNPV